MKIIFTELQQQDPFKPNDSSALLDQLNSIRQIESDMQLTEQLESIVFQNQLASASNMIGKVVQGLESIILLSKVEVDPEEEDCPTVPCIVVDCGRLP